ncbi:hypothetical protein HFP51_07695 [Parasphingopyxis sp. CP4]|uniref:ATP-binding protein n=1 Tax=Parasphingopyxis sp. CP4 TaxID=2724527 RepID=UPI0015A0958B|nr:ATP-binding protein [Parasphingopyxis sp. CP4]QLC22072.1 hypothetical protein HFP51_07695 [Parasphingopyxis sp. CP4]
MAKFNVSARTVDMLGRQQIAGIPTAISELFKNAHDAYANTVEVDYYREDRLFVLRDDGLGMTVEDFEKRWLTLGTDSKLKGGELKPPPSDGKKKKRPILGEKGIGRLAIALIGPQVLVITRARVKGVPHKKTVVAYVHWGWFELPGLDISDAVIPVREIKGGTLPTKEDVLEMVGEARDALNEVSKKSLASQIAKIAKEMDAFDIDPSAYFEFLGDPNLTGKGCGTHFFIRPADDIIESDLDDEENGVTRFQRSLIGFTNTMSPGHAKPVIETRVRDHRDEGDPIEVIGNKAFFTPDEYEMVDHHFTGRFDEYGQFQGEVAIYQTEPEPYVLNWSDSKGRRTQCGPFNFSFAYLQGQARNSLVPPDEYVQIQKKLERIGGLYIYRDGIRVQPYGDSDYDFLHIEQRRSQGAAYYIYSYRRIMGAIDLTGAQNPHLMEKAGREGFRENLAFREFRSILINFFIQTAGDFFRQSGQFSESFIGRRAEFERLHEIRKASEQKRNARKAKLTRQLNDFFENHDANLLTKEMDDLLAETNSKLDSLSRRKSSPQTKALSFLRLEKEQLAKVGAIRARITIEKPPGLVTSAQMRGEWASYFAEFQHVEEEIIAPRERELERIISQKVEETKIPLQPAIRLEEKIKFEGRQSKELLGALQSEAEGSIEEISTKVRTIARKSFSEIDATIKQIIEDLSDLDSKDLEEEKFSKIRGEYENKLTDAFEAEQANLVRLRDQIALVSQAWQEGYSSIELTDALESQVEELRRESDRNLELAQIGLAINTINHEFEKTVGSLRNGFRRLNKWAEINPDFAPLYQEMRVSFDHLDGYLSLFTPLDRRIYQNRVDITGKNISDFLEDLFEVRFKRHEVRLRATAAFNKAKVHEYPSTMYPVFVNLIDNAIYWLSGKKDKKREIQLDYKNGSFIVHDNGPGVELRDRENIFELSFTRKPSGRGMGLYISRAVLEKQGYTLALDNDRTIKGAKFLITKSKG